MNIIQEGKKVFEIEIDALNKTKDIIGDSFSAIVEAITSCEGKIIVTGMGKPGHIAKKIAATLASLGTPAFYLHPAEAMHGDLGMITSKDIVFAISYSGESNEILNILPNIKLIGSKLIALTGNADSTLAKVADICDVFPKFNEACILGLAPTSSTTAALCYGDAIAVVASNIYDFQNLNYSRFHPAGSLGKKLVIKVSDLMAKENNNAIVYENATLKEAIIELSKKGLGIVNVIDKDHNLLGVITDGDLRRQLEKGVDIYHLFVYDVMTKSPKTTTKGQLAVDALKIMKEHNVSCLPVLNEEGICGTIRLQDIIGIGIFL
ncbi:MAG: KpsF/GutQ family sugar-phosphate isomerase [Bacteroidales bacterium]|nr:KpsF/GutQ family sugar-phosphate isomerase [Bacteroidales bacterium]